MFSKALGFTVYTEERLSVRSPAKCYYFQDLKRVRATVERKLPLANDKPQRQRVLALVRCDLAQRWRASPWKKRPQLSLVQAMMACRPIDVCGDRGPSCLSLRIERRVQWPMYYVGAKSLSLHHEAYS